MRQLLKISLTRPLRRLPLLLPALLMACVDAEEDGKHRETDVFCPESLSEDCAQDRELLCYDSPFGCSDNAGGGDPVPQAADSWIRLPGVAYDIGVATSDAAWVIGANPVSGGYGIYSWNGSVWARVDGGAVRIAVEPSGRPWVINDAGHIYRRDGGGWQLLPGLALDIGIGSDGSVYVIGLSIRSGGNGIYHWNGSNWNEVGGGALRITVDPKGQPWVVNDVGNIYRWSGGGWQYLPGRARDIGAGASGAVWVIGNNPVPGGYGIYQWDGVTWNGVDGGAVAVSVDAAGLPWVVNDSGSIYRRL